ncbi:MAG: 4-hydroxythreonine-4-phosphate dehydrogenase PdxA [Flavobacteriales bacterium]|nr:4-hydroxythreonine-4-phosphate dehydrogenase PdxA [Flavobacteriales bacterium]
MINNKIIIGISVGDINGIGTEVIIKTFDNPAMLELCTPVIFGSSKLISYYKKLSSIDMSFVGIENMSQIIPGKVNIMNLWQDAPVITPGKDTEEGGKLAFSSLEAATKALADGSVDALVTAPINKKNIQNPDFHFHGHTEYLESKLQGEALMFLVSPQLKIAVATGHIAISEVSDAITTDLIEKRVLQMEDSLKKDFGVRRPKIAVLGLDPHVGDGGVIGVKDSEVIAPTVESLFNQGHCVFGPYSSDGFFGSEAYKNFDAILAMYHDQGLIPFKTIAFEDGVNFTAGLSRVRTSPDHGTGYDIAGKDAADPSSFRTAVYDAIDIFQKRMEYDALTANVLTSQTIRNNYSSKNEEDPDMAGMED